MNRHMSADLGILFFLSSKIFPARRKQEGTAVFLEIQHTPSVLKAIAVRLPEWNLP
jgi:hypothetical protein